MDYPDFPPKHPLSDIIHQVYQAIVSAHRHLCARQGSLTEQDVHLFGRLRETMWMQYFTSAHIFEEARIAIAKQPEVPPEIVDRQV